MSAKEQELLEEAARFLKEEERKSAAGEDFNIFSILNMERREVETHSAFLYELLRPEGGHHQGAVFLKLFLETMLGGASDTFTNPEIMQEYITPKGRRIDFVITTDDRVVAIEMKIDAQEQENQLTDYHDAIEKDFPDKAHEFIFLSLEERKAQSAGSSEVHWKNKTFKEHIAKFLERAQAACEGKLHLREAIRQYGLLIQKLTTDEDRKMGVLGLGNELESIKAAEAIRSALLEAYARRELEFWRKLQDELHEDLRKCEDEWQSPPHLWAKHLSRFGDQGETNEEFLSVVKENQSRDSRDRYHRGLTFGKWLRADTLFIRIEIGTGYPFVFWLQVYLMRKNPSDGSDLVVIDGEGICGVKGKGYLNAAAFEEIRCGGHKGFRPHCGNEMWMFHEARFRNVRREIFTRIHTFLECLEKEKQIILQKFEPSSDMG
ncbi:MAG: PD-(D/E)XK nuclease family protein [Candidatus Accumulibacter sp.]|jgi:hypothetical protein|nr:PD-(D/E)XK nuclease family protein [Accumulibacter sp.]